MSKKIEAVINAKLKGDSQKNALDFIAYLRTGENAKYFTIEMHDEKDESGWNVANLGFIIITGNDGFPGPWTMWFGVNNIGEHLKNPIDEKIKEFAWSHISPCGNCGGNCNPTLTKVFGKEFENTCQSNLLLVNPNAEAVEYMKKLSSIKIDDIIRNLSKKA